MFIMAAHGLCFILVPLMINWMGPFGFISSLRCGEQKGYTNRRLLSVMKKCVAEFIGTFALVFAGTVNPSTIRLSGKSEWRGDAIFLRSNVRMLRMKFLAAQSERLPYGHSEAPWSLDGIWLSILRSMGERPPTLCKDGATITSLRRGGLCCELSVAVLHR